MSTTQIPAGNPASPSPPAPRPDGGDLYDGQRWESVYREMHDVPALLIQLQDDLSRSRRREALWMSVVVHLFIVILFINAQLFDRLLPRRPVLVVGPTDWMRQKELTYLELPPDEQKLTQRPDTDKISDKDRIATSRAPHLDRQEMKQILDSARPGVPGPGGEQTPQPEQPPAQAMAQPAPEQQSTVPFPFPNQDRAARLSTPSQAKPSFTTPSLSAGSQVTQAARASVANRGGYGGDGGDFGLGQGRKATATMGQWDVLSDTMGVDFAPYLSRILHGIRENWIRAIPEAARYEHGKVSIEFAILKNGSMAGIQLHSSSGEVSLDRAAWAGITGSNPFPQLPNDFGGQYLSLRLTFCYNLEQCDLK